MRGVTFSNFAAKKFDSQKVDHGPTLSLRIFIRFARKNSPSGNQPLCHLRVSLEKIEELVFFKESIYLGRPFYLD